MLKFGKNCSEDRHRRRRLRAPSTCSSVMLYENTNAMPKHADGTVLHLGVKHGEVANRVVSVGSLDRARVLAGMLDGGQVATHESSRGFTVFTGEMLGVSVSIIATGMGAPNMDFVVRETRAIVDGPMAIIRFGTCGGIQQGVPPGSVVVSSQGSVSIVRNPDAFFADAAADAEHYRVSRVMPASAPLSMSVRATQQQSRTLEARRDCKSLLSIMESREAEFQTLAGKKVGVYGGLNATACSFYSSQGRIDAAFDDRNERVVENLLAGHPELHSLEMETFHLLDLAQRSRGSIVATAAALVVANRQTGEVVDAQVLAAGEAFWGRAVLECIAKHEF
ncbi:hypothetical protein PybrP1_000840 [[Pythium] brassicae (nom. inval.)]|nr:hypothetical protein PybrP1_000840 [[Pythium] brassicae (nom. inval.)]